MKMYQPESTVNDIPPSRGRGISGKWVLLALIGGALIVVPVATWATLRWVESGLIETPRLNWHSRERWPSPTVRWTTVERQGLQLSSDAGRWRELAFNLDDHDLAVTEMCLDLARRAEADREAFIEPAVGGTLRQLAGQAGDNFYPHYLLGTWHRLRGDEDLADASYRHAFQLAHGAIKQRYVTPAGQPVADLAVGTFEIVHARSDGHELDESLVLVYPALVTDADGYVYLPVHETLYRIHRAPEPGAGEAVYDMEQWFDFPDRVGTLRPAVVRPATP